MKKHETYTFLNTHYFYSNEERKEIAKGIADCNNIGFEDVTDEMIDDEIWNNEEIDYEETLSAVNKLLKNNTLIAFMDIGRWDGRVSGYYFIQNESDFRNLLEDYNTVYLEDGELCLYATHHDGVNYYRLKALTNAGKELAKRVGFSEYTSNTFDNNIRTRRIKLEELVG